jgi:cyclopropane fatty-acyl-phospholipid synthase-like methyltransferase
VTRLDHYLLGYSDAEEARLGRQSADLAPDSDAQFEKIGIKPGERVVDLGCSPGSVLNLLAKCGDRPLCRATHAPSVSCRRSGRYPR